MIFYFSGTGNSKYTAEKIAQLTHDSCTDIADVFNGKAIKNTGNKDVTGFVFPVYYSGLPEIVKRFVSHKELKKHLGSYIFCIVTCGAQTGATELMLKKKLGREIDYYNHLLMPDNYTVMYNPSSGEEAKKTLAKAEAKIKKIATEIENRSNNKKTRKTDPTGIVIYPLYALFRTTAFFKPDENCNSCGLCKKVCPDNAIEIVDGKPVWNKKKCQHCMACINRCPKSAIQFTSLTKKRNRYDIRKIEW